MARTRQIIFSMAAIFVVLLLLEGGARLAESFFDTPDYPDNKQTGWQTVFFGSLFDWHEPDPDLLWRFKAGLDNPLITTNSDHFLGGDIDPEKSSGTRRIFVLGDSSPVGLGLKSRRQTFPEILKFLLDRQYHRNRQVEVINAAVSGYSSEQVRRLLETRIWKYNPDLIVIYCGNNDASISGTITDTELFAAQKFKGLRSILSRSAFYRLLRGVLAVRQEADEKHPLQLKTRVSPERYENNLADIAEQCRRYSCPLVILKPPVPYLWPAGLQFKPFIHLTGGDGEVILPEDIAAILGRNLAYCLDEKRYSDLYGKSDIFTREVYRAAFRDTLEPPDAVRYYLKRIEAGDETPVNYNNLGVNYWLTGRFDKADSSFVSACEIFEKQNPGINLPAVWASFSPLLFNRGINLLSIEPAREGLWYDTSGTAFAFLDSALQADYFSLRIKKEYWEKIDNTEVNAGLAVIDLPGIFGRNGGESLFIDHCHPTAPGHLLIAKALCDTINSRRW